MINKKILEVFIRYGQEKHIKMILLMYCISWLNLINSISLKVFAGLVKEINND